MLLLGAATAAAQSVDNQLWLDQNFSFTLSPRTALRVEFIERMDDNASHLFEANTRIALAIKVNSWLSVVPGFRHVRHDPPVNRISSFEHRPLVDIEVQTRRGAWRPSLRTRFEGRFFENQDGFLRVRLRPALQYTLPTGGKRPPALVVNNEFFYDTRTDQYRRNKFLAGISLPATEHFTLLPCYMLLSNRRPAAWKHDNVWGLSLFWNF